jgi:hypothetical protein
VWSIPFLLTKINGLWRTTREGFLLKGRGEPPARPGDVTNFKSKEESRNDINNRPNAPTALPPWNPLHRVCRCWSRNYCLAFCHGVILHHKGGTSIWTFAMLATVATVFVLLFGGCYRYFFVTIAVVPPFLCLCSLRLTYLGWNHPIKPFLEYFLYFVMTPIFLVWMVAVRNDT